MPLEQITITRPADMHAHFRDDLVLRTVVPATARHFDIAVAMPNLTPPITTIEAARHYCERIEFAARSVNREFRALGIAYLTDDLDPKVLEEGFRNDNEQRQAFFAAKLYPANATTNSAHGVSSIEKIFPVLETMEQIGMPLLIHGELLERNGVEYVPWDRERAFVEYVLPEIAARFSNLRMVLEHISTAEAVEYLLPLDELIAGSITPHHLTSTASDMVRGGFRPHAYCMPILKAERDREKLREAATWPFSTWGKPKFFAGTDTAPHLASRKYCECCAAGAFVAPGALEAYAAVFEEEGVFVQDRGIERFERFMSLNGPEFYGISPSNRKITLVRNDEGEAMEEKFLVPRGDGTKEEIVPFYRPSLGFAPPFPYKVD